MISDRDDWVPRKIAPFIWLNRERTETSARPPAGKTSASKAIARNKSSPPAPATRSINEKSKTCVDGPEQAEASGEQFSEQDATGEQLRMPLLMVAADEEAGDDKRNKLRSGRRARVMDLGRRVGGKLEEKGKHIVGKMRENTRSNSLLLPDLERPAPAPTIL